MENANVDVIVVGAGVVGCSIAYHLTEAGLKVALLDKGPVGAGASSANFGMVQSNDVETKHSIPMVTRSYARFDSLEEELGMPFEFRHIEALSLLTKDSQRQTVQHRVSTMSAAGIDVEFIPPERIAEIEPLVDPHSLIGAVYSARQGQLNPFKLMWAYIKKAQQKGLSLHAHTEVTGFNISSGKVRGVKTNHGNFSASTVVLATAAWTRPLGLMLGKDWDIGCFRGSVMVTNPVSSCRLRTIVTSADHVEIDVTGPDDVELTILALTQVPNGNFLVAQANRTGEEVNPVISYSAPKAMAIMAQRFFPILRGLNIIRSWAAPTTFTPDGCPLVGPVDGLEGLLLAASFRSAVINSPIAGEMITELVTKGRCDVVDITPFLPHRSMQSADTVYKTKRAD